ncbi:hypothetical protein DL768_009975 [Monosporascus sp. mg162]|nr:hypothetical protein DL768_009975 [Monosporascus sp. mg162]
MLLIAIVDELERQLKQLKQPHQPSTTVLSYFFCQGTNSALNNATAVLRGLIYLFGVRNPSLLSYLRKRYDTARSKLFEDANAFFALSEVLEGMLRHSSLSRVYIVIDALDECVAGMEMLLNFILRNTSESPRVKWIVSSRNHVEQRLDNSGITLSLELTQNAKQVADAVNAYIDFKISELPSLDNNVHKPYVRDTMRQKADGTFLWVALVIQELKNVKSWHVLKVVEEIPAGLEELYGRMIKYIQHLKRDAEFCRRVLSTVTLAYRPLRLAELGVLSGLPNEITGSMNNMRDIVAMCGSFLTIQNGYVYLIHQSVKDYLSGKASSTIFPSGPIDVHHAIFSRSLETMSTLRRNIYGLHHLGPIGEVKTPEPDPLAAMGD